jgi:hypothetical protein
VDSSLYEGYSWSLLHEVPVLDANNQHLIQIVDNGSIPGLPRVKCLIRPMKPSRLDRTWLSPSHD